jgi:predicted component of type VI protein secretion system
VTRFADHEVYGQLTSEKNWRSSELPEFNIVNFRDFLFEIAPKLNFQFHNQLHEKSRKAAVKSISGDISAQRAEQ